MSAKTRRTRTPQRKMIPLTPNTATPTFQKVLDENPQSEFSENLRNDEIYTNGSDSNMNIAKRKNRSSSSDDQLSIEPDQCIKKSRSERSTPDSGYIEECTGNKPDIFTTENNESVQNNPETSEEVNDLTIQNSPETSEEVHDLTIEPSRFRRQVKPKGLTEQELKIRREQQLSYLNTFVNISLKYSQFLEKKIDITQASEAAVAPTSTKDNDITKELRYFVGKLHEYQIEGVTWLKVLFENSVNGILADEMGLGKTVQIIALFSHLYQRKVAGPFLVVAPLSTLGNWESEFKRFAPKIPVVRFHGNAQERREQMTKICRQHLLDNRRVRPVVICSYQTPLMEENFLRKFTWQYIVVDEGQRIKNPNTQLSKGLRALNSVNRTLLTGTPLQNEIKELWALFNFLMPELFKDIEGFSTLLELDDMKDTEKLLANEARTKVISTIHKVLAPFMLRREKKLVLNDLVPKKELIVYCSLTEMQSYLYRATLQKDTNKLTMAELEPKEPKFKSKRSCRLTAVDYNCIEEINDADHEYDYRMIEKKIPTKNCTTTGAFIPSNRNVPIKCPNGPYMCYLTMQSPTSMLKKIVNHPYLVWCPLNPDVIQTRKEVLVTEDLIKHSGKLMVLDAMLPKLRDSGHKVLIFSTLVMFMDMIEEMLIMRQYQYRRLDGRSSYDNRNQTINEFMEDSNVFLFLLSTRAGGLGLNLTAADTVIFMDRDWNPMADLQAQDRCHRIGQTKPVMIYSLITKGTIDEVILNCGDMKRRLEKVVLQEGKFKTLKKSFNDDQIQELEDLFNREEKLSTVKSNGLIYTDEELDEILDRDKMFKEIGSSKK